MHKADNLGESKRQPASIRCSSVSLNGCEKMPETNWQRASTLNRPAISKTQPKNAESIVSIGNQTGEGWFLTGEMLELMHQGVPNIICAQPFACLPNHIVGKGVIKELRHEYPKANIVAIDYDPGASEVNQAQPYQTYAFYGAQELKKRNCFQINLHKKQVSLTRD